MTLPPLPAPHATSFYANPLFTDDQMRAYGEACAAAERERAARVAEQQAEPVRECADNDSPWLICKPCAAVGRCAKLPVAWRSKERINGEFDSGWKLTSNEPPQTPRTIAIEPLYTHPPQQRKPLRRGVNGVCSRSTCLCERDGLGDECIWLRAHDIGEAP